MMDAGPVRKRKIGIWLKCAAVLLLLSPQSCLAQIMLGRLSFTKAKVDPLDNPTRLAAGLSSYDYLSSVGGIAFGSEAVGDQGLTVLAIERDPRRKDGERLQVTMQMPNGRKDTFTAPISDWQLVPVARFALTDQDACFSLFGRVADDAEQQQRLARGERLLTYHPAFRDTLLGLRMFQGDILILEPDACDLPKVQGKYLLGSGESPPNVVANQQAYRNIGTVIANFPTPFRSYVVCDYGQKITFSIKRDQLLLTGAPYWYCWRSKIEDAQALQKLQDKANLRGNETCQREYLQDVEELGETTAAAKWSEAFQRQRHREVFDKVLSVALLQPLPEMSRAISTEVERLRVNPAVYDALVTTMRYAALFRHFKAHDPMAYTAFVESLQHVKLSPEVETPSVLIEPAERRRVRSSR